MQPLVIQSQRQFARVTWLADLPRRAAIGAGHADNRERLGLKVRHARTACAQRSGRLAQNGTWQQRNSTPVNHRDKGGQVAQQGRRQLDAPHPVQGGLRIGQCQFAVQGGRACGIWHSRGGMNRRHHLGHQIAPRIKIVCLRKYEGMTIMAEAARCGKSGVPDLPFGGQGAVLTISSTFGISAGILSLISFITPGCCACVSCGSLAITDRPSGVA